MEGNWKNEKGENEKTYLVRYRYLDANLNTQTTKDGMEYRICSWVNDHFCIPDKNAHLIDKNTLEWIEI